MYQLESYGPDGATVTHALQPYRAIFAASDAADAERVVVELNRPDMLAALAAYRFEFETAGLALPDGLRVKTDRESQAQLSAAFTTLNAGMVPDTDWKAANGWEVVTLEQVAPIAKAVAAHVRGCFRAERTVQAAIITASTMAEIEAIDIRAQFAATYAEAFAEVMAPPDPAVTPAP